jgi:hypothetical protein
MPFEPGNQEARKKGANKVSLKVKEAIVDFLERNIETIQKSFDTLKDKEKLEFIANILPYAAPKLSSVQTDNETRLSGGIAITWEEPQIHSGHGQSTNGVVRGLSNGQENHS